MAKKKENTAKSAPVEVYTLSPDGTFVKVEADKEKKKYHVTSTTMVRTLLIKIYIEQLDGQTEEQLDKRIVNINSSKIEVFKTKHDMDDNKDDFWEPATVKEHYHICVRVLNGKTMRVSTILKMLGIKYRKDIDDELARHSLTTAKDFSSSVQYLTHETKKAMAEGKYVYDPSIIVSNVSREKIDEIRLRHTVEDLNDEDKYFDDLDKKAYRMGYALEDWEEFKQTLPLKVKSRGIMRTISESYYHGVKKRGEEDGHLIKLCIYVQGEKNMGKTFAAVSICKTLGLKTLLINGGKTGKFDNLSVTHQAIILDDEHSSNVLNLTDNKFCTCYRRNSNNAVFCGNTVIVTSNEDFGTFLERCGAKPENYDAIRSRFFVCRVKEAAGHYFLSPDFSKGRPDRGTDEEQNERNRRFIEFRDLFDKSIDEYMQSKKKSAVDWTEIEKPNKWVIRENELIEIGAILSYLRNEYMNVFEMQSKLLKKYEKKFVKYAGLSGITLEEILHDPKWIKVGKNEPDRPDINKYDDIRNIIDAENDYHRIYDKSREKIQDYIEQLAELNYPYDAEKEFADLFENMKISDIMRDHLFIACGPEPVDAVMSWLNSVYDTFREMSVKWRNWYDQCKAYEDRKKEIKMIEEDRENEEAGVTYSLAERMELIEQVREEAWEEVEKHNGLNVLWIRDKYPDLDYMDILINQFDTLNYTAYEEWKAEYLTRPDHLCDPALDEAV